MFLFTILAKPGPEIEEEDPSIGGAYVSVWVALPEQEGAEVVARCHIKDAGWLPARTTDVHWVVEGDYEEGDENRQYYLEAQRYGSCVCFDEWPKDAEDAGVDYEAE